MCPKGHSLLLRSGGVLGRWRWAAHARTCAACAEVRAAARFVEAFAARAGRWPAAGEAVPARRGRRAWKLAAAAAVIVLILPLALSVRWVRGRHASTSPPAVTSAREVRVVHWVGTQTIHGKVLPMEMTIAYPDKERGSLNGDTSITDWSTGYDLNIRAQPISYSWHPTPFRYIRSRAPGGITRTGDGHRPRPDWYTLAGRMRGLQSGGAKLLRHTESKLENGNERHELEYQLAEAPWAPYSIKLEVDPRTDLILAWDETNHATDEVGQRYSWRVTADRVEYNPNLPPDYFSTEPPPGEEVMDYSTAEGLKAIYGEAIAEVKKLASDPERQRNLVAEVNQAHLFDSMGLSELSSGDRQVILAKLAAFGIERDGRPVVAAARPGEQERGPAEQAIGVPARNSHDRDKVVLEAPPPRRGMAPPLTKEQIEERYQVQALSRTQNTEAQPAQLEEDRRAAAMHTAEAQRALEAARARKAAEESRKKK
jgi:hypothetical protein